MVLLILAITWYSSLARLFLLGKLVILWWTRNQKLRGEGKHYIIRLFPLYLYLPRSAPVLHPHYFSRQFIISLSDWVTRWIASWKVEKSLHFCTYHDSFPLSLSLQSKLSSKTAVANFFFAEMYCYYCFTLEHNSLGMLLVLRMETIFWFDVTFVVVISPEVSGSGMAPETQISAFLLQFKLNNALLADD